MGGTFAPLRRAFESPIAIACLRLLTFLPERPERSFPLFIFFIAPSTLRPERFEYLRLPRDFLRPLFLRPEDLRPPFLRVDFLVVDFLRVDVDFLRLDVDFLRELLRFFAAILVAVFPGLINAQTTTGRAGSMHRFATSA